MSLTKQPTLFKETYALARLLNIRDCGPDGPSQITTIIIIIYIKLNLFFGGGGRAVRLEIGQNLILDHAVYYNWYIEASFNEHKNQCRSAAELVGGGYIRPKIFYYISR